MIAVMASVLWVRSLEVTDAFYSVKHRSYTQLLSSDGVIRWGEYTHLSDDPPSSFFIAIPVGYSRAKTSLLKNFPLRMAQDWWDIQYDWEFAGFVFTAGETGYPQNRSKVGIWIIPYWSIAVPLTLLSAYLLLSRLHTPNQPATSPDA